MVLKTAIRNKDLPFPSNVRGQWGRQLLRKFKEHALHSETLHVEALQFCCAEACLPISLHNFFVNTLTLITTASHLCPPLREKGKKGGREEQRNFSRVKETSHRSFSLTLRTVLGEVGPLIPCWEDSEPVRVLKSLPLSMFAQQNLSSHFNENQTTAKDLSIDSE